MSGKVLLLSWHVPPEMCGAATVIGNLAKEFSREEMVVAGQQPDPNLPREWRHEWPELVYLIKGWPKTRRGARWWRKLQFPILLLGCVRLVRKHRCTALIVVFPKEEFLLAGYLTGLWTRAKFYPYFHNTYLENRKGLSLLFARWLQARTFARAERVFVISEGMAELYRERYPDLNCSALVHTFNGDIPNSGPSRPLGSPLRMAIFGNINESCREATERVCKTMRQVEDASLTILSATRRSYFQKLGLLSDTVFHETVPHSEIMTRLQQADILVLPHGFSGNRSAVEYRTIFPTRIIEYLISGRPIIAHSPPDCFLTRFLRKHNCALIVEEADSQAIKNAIARLREEPHLRQELVVNALRVAENFRAPRVAQELRAHLG